MGPGFTPPQIIIIIIIFYSQINLIFCFVDGNFFFFLIKASHSFLFLSLKKKYKMDNSNLLDY